MMQIETTVSKIDFINYDFKRACKLKQIKNNDIK